MLDKAISRRGFLTLSSSTLLGTATTSGSTAVAPSVGRAGRRIMSRDSPVLSSHFVTVAGREIHWLAGGEREIGEAPLVLVHGLALSGQYMVPLAEALAERHLVYAPDLPGFGDSDKPDRVLDVPRLGEALAQWLEATGMPPCVLIGNSFGCQIILEAASRWPDRVVGMVLQGPTTPIEERAWFWQLVRWRQNAPNNPPLMGEVADIDYAKCGFARALSTFEFSIRDRPEEKLARISIPALIIRGGEDPICHQHWAELLTAGLPAGHLSVLPDIAHTLVFTSPDEMRGEIEPFLAGI